MFTFALEMLCGDYNMAKKIEHEGVIIDINLKTIYIRIRQESACSGCHANKICSVAESKDKIIEIPYISGKHKTGDSVFITGKTSMGLKAVFYAFVIPLILIIISLGITTRFRCDEGLTAGIALAVPFFYYLLLYSFREKLKQKFTFSIK